MARKLAPLISAAGALIITPLVSLMTRPSEGSDTGRIFNSIGRGHEAEGDAEPFHLIPDSLIGKFGALLALAGITVFLIGIFSAAGHFRAADALAVIGLVSVLVGGAIRAFSD